MWEISSRGVVGLLSVFVGSVILYNAWGLILVLAILLFLVVNTCYSLLVNDSLISSHNLLVFRYVKDTALELNKIVRELLDAVKRYYQQHYSASNMNRSRRTSYHLSSSNSLVNARDSSSLINTNVDQLSPIGKRNFPWNEESRYIDNDNESVIKHTSTPLVSWKKENLQNGEPLGAYSLQRSSTKVSPLQKRNHTLSRGERIIFTPEGSPWGTSISPKIRAKGQGIKTVQTVAGPLLASTRYNIDSKVYSDITSPGLATRLSKYASDVNNKLLNQSQYGMGHFPKVNLNASSASLINARTSKMSVPVTVRIAQPEAVKYSSSERLKLANVICNTENNKSSNVIQALKEIPLKRQASREDITSELVKKQRTEGIYSDELENLEEMTQKRARDDSPKSDDDDSLNVSSRPLKRSKAQSCNDILNSLSSSIHVLSGVKRKATDTSRSSTPDMEKHFKPLDKSQSKSSISLAECSDTLKSVQKLEIKPLAKIRDSSNSDNNLEEKISSEKITNIIPIKPISPSEEVSHNNLEMKRPQFTQISRAPQSPKRLADKLFMREEPKNNEKLKTLIGEQNDKDKFSIVDQDEIKKKDILNMRQTSMKERLQSMFDAISGKAAKKINTDVVIQAEISKEPESSTVSTTYLTSLTSLTTTTNVNTTPISSPVVPILKTASNKKTPTKHVTFNFPGEKPTMSSSTPFIPPTESLPSNSNASETPAPIPPTISMTSPGKTLNQTSTSVSQESFSSSAEALTDKTSTSPITGASSVSTNLFAGVSQLNNLQNRNISQTLNVGQTAISTQSSGIIFGTTTTTTSNSQANPSIDTKISLSKTTTTTPTSTSSPAFSFTVSSNSSNNPISAPVMTFGTNVSTSITSPVSTQQTTQAQTLPTFGSVSSTFSVLGNSATSTNPSTNIVETSSTGSKTLITSTTFAFGNFTTTKSFSFGSTNNASTSAPVFGANNTPTFGTIKTLAKSPSTSTPYFGTSTNTSQNTSNFASGLDNKSLNCSTSSDQSKSFGTPTTSISIFGSSTTVTTSVSFVPVNTQSAFGSNSSGFTNTFETAKTTASIFKSNSCNSTTASNFFGNSNVNTTVSSNPPTFGTTVTTTNMFNQVNTAQNSTPSAFTLSTTTTTTTTTSSPFSGNNSNNSTPAKPTVVGSGASIFGQTESSSFSASPSNFGNIGTIIFKTPTTNSGFNPSTTKSTSISSFGSTIFGSQNSSSISTKTSENSNFPTFGSISATTAGFGATSNISLQTQSNSGELGFGTRNNNNNTANSTSLFGTNQTPSFGSTGGGNVFGTSSSSTASFQNPLGNNNSANSNTGGAFTFGAGGNQTQTQGTPVFSFGGTSSSSNAPTDNATGTPFQFGSTASKPSGTGFNFTAPPSTPSINFGASSNPPVFNAPTPGINTFSAPSAGMFSIGSGSTAPKSRPTRARRQR